MGDKSADILDNGAYRVGITVLGALIDSLILLYSGMYYLQRDVKYKLLSPYSARA